MIDMIKTPFHGELEPIREAGMQLPTVAIEGIEVVVFICAIYFIFFAFNKELFKKTTPPMESKKKPSLFPGMSHGPAQHEKHL